MAIKELLVGKTKEEKANIKGLEIVAAFKAEKHKKGKRFAINKTTKSWK